MSAPVARSLQVSYIDVQNVSLPKSDQDVTCTNRRTLYNSLTKGPDCLPNITLASLDIHFGLHNLEYDQDVIRGLDNLAWRTANLPDRGSKW